ncbi:MAG: DEAD/DEAH box helicase family protein [Terriglobia bacterium]|jgi:type III restriction enzyme
MQLKDYQKRVVREVKAFLEALATQQASANKHASEDAWDVAKTRFDLPGQYRPRKNGLGKDLPTFCIKVPTGGGKTLLATQILGSIYETILKERSGSGLVLWVVPSDQIYKDTIKALRDRKNFHRESLEFAVSRRIEVWEKHEIARLTPGQLRSNLNILVLKLASTNRETREQLKFFRDSGGNIVQHFPAENESEKNKALKARIPNLDMLAEDEKRDQYLIKTSLGNLVRLCEPAVILDEGHKATSKLARETIEGFNASIVVELSATPQKEANILVRVSGRELLSEQMIKLPINVANSNQKSWQDCLTQARDRQSELAKLAAKYYGGGGRLIRPIVLVQVERTGKDQLDAGLVHSEQVKKHLIERLDVPKSAIAIKTSEKDDIEGIDLLAEDCPVEWIITKAALQEGWDCPFAYILVSLNNTGRQQSMTQLVGRVLRQPYAEKTRFDELNESYVFCLRRRAAEITGEVKKALEQEGYEGDLMSVVDRSDTEGHPTPERESAMRKEFRAYYREFDGKVYLPRFCVKRDDDYEALDYFRHLISEIDVAKFDYADADWNLSQELAGAKDSFYRITLDQDVIEPVEQRQAASLETDDQVKSWLVASLSFDYYSYKQLRQIVERATQELAKRMPEIVGQLGMVKFPIREKITGLIERQTDEQTRVVFEGLFNKKNLCFFLECREARFEIPPRVNIRATRWLARDDNEPLQRSLFDRVPDELNQYERSVALYLDNHPEVLWWYRNLVGPECFSIQGYRRNKIYPDFVVQRGRGKKPVASVLVIESKGKQLRGSEDTNYKRNVAEYFGKVGHKVPWQRLAKDFADQTFRIQVLDEGEYKDRDWKADLRVLLTEPVS